MGYRVSDNVTEHKACPPALSTIHTHAHVDVPPQRCQPHTHTNTPQAVGLGVYHFFRDHTVTANSAVACPSNLQSSFRSVLAMFLSGKGTLRHVLNGDGIETSPTSPLSDTDIGHSGWVGC